MVVQGVHLGRIVSMVTHKEKIFVATEGCVYELNSATGELTPCLLHMNPASLPQPISLPEEITPV